MKFADLSRLNALNSLLGKIKNLQGKKRDYPRWHVEISFKGSGWSDNEIIEDDEFMKGLDSLLQEQRRRVIDRIKALGIKDAA